MFAKWSERDKLPEEIQEMWRVLGETVDLDRRHKERGVVGCVAGFHRVASQGGSWINSPVLPIRVPIRIAYFPRSTNRATAWDSIRPKEVGAWNPWRKNHTANFWVWLELDPMTGSRTLELEKNHADLNRALGHSSSAWPFNEELYLEWNVWLDHLRESFPDCDLKNGFVQLWEPCDGWKAGHARPHDTRKRVLSRFLLQAGVTSDAFTVVRESDKMTVFGGRTGAYRMLTPEELKART